jgi:hypothetical protein
VGLSRLLVVVWVGRGIRGSTAIGIPAVSYRLDCEYGGIAVVTAVAVERMLVRVGISS